MPNEQSLREALRLRAREMRNNPTPAEDALWSVLRNRQLGGFKFRRQHRILPFILDFYCVQLKLAIEVDGPIHELSKEQDEFRTKYLNDLGIDVLRFSNEQVLNDMIGVARLILERCSQ